MIDFSIIISTMNDRYSKIPLDQTNSLVKYIIIHQIYNMESYDYNISNLLYLDNLDYIRLNFPGLSKSRNTGLDNVKTKYAYIMDDDVDYDSNKIKKLVEWMNINDIDVATCQFMHEDKTYPKNYSSKPFQHNLLSASKVSSIEICVNVEKIRKKGIRFDENFGLGTELPSGEEYIFITDCIKARLNVWYYPITTGIHPNITSGMDFYSNINKTLAKREMFKRVFGKKAFLFIFLFWLKKAPKVLHTGFFISFTKTLLLGQK